LRKEVLQKTLTVIIQGTVSKVPAIVIELVEIYNHRKTKLCT